MGEAAEGEVGAPERDGFDMTSVKDASSLSVVGAVIGVVLLGLILLMALSLASPEEEITSQEASVEEPEDLATDAMAAEIPMADPTEDVPFPDLANACAADNTPAAGVQCNELGIKYLAGEGVTKSPFIALGKFNQGCEKGALMACTNAGWLYAGNQGVLSWPEKSFELLQRGCNADIAFACAELGVNYEKGIGVALDPGKARSLYDYACSEGWQQACDYRRELDEAVGL